MSRLAEAMKRANAETEVTRPDQGETVQWEKPAAPVIAPVPAAEAAVEVEAAPQASEPAPTPRIHSSGSGLAAEKLVVTPSISPVSLEQYRRLAATLHRQQTERGIKSVMVASTLPGEGKTLTAVNLALTFSESYGRQVLLIDGDLRRPTTHDVLDVPNILGLGAGLTQEADQKLSLIRVSPRLSVLTAGQPDPDPMSRLASDRMRRVMAEAAAQFDWVIIDTPPVGKVPDANLLAAMSDVVLLVVQAGRTPAKLVQRTAEAVGVQKVVGVVLNRAEDRLVTGESASVYGYDRYAPTV
jgi:capsular exopolysaccharide synthesis family protein